MKTKILLAKRQPSRTKSTPEGDTGSLTKADEGTLASGTAFICGRKKPSKAMQSIFLLALSHDCDSCGLLQICSSLIELKLSTKHKLYCDVFGTYYWPIEEHSFTQGYLVPLPILTLIAKLCSLHSATIRRLMCSFPFNED